MGSFVRRYIYNDLDEGYHVIFTSMEKASAS